MWFSANSWAVVGYGGWRAIYPPPIGTKSCHPHVLIIGRTHPYRVALVSTYDRQQLILCFISRLKRGQRGFFRRQIWPGFFLLKQNNKNLSLVSRLTPWKFQLDQSVLHLFGNISSVDILTCPSLHFSSIKRSTRQNSFKGKLGICLYIFLDGNFWQFSSFGVVPAAWRDPLKKYM